MTSFIIIAILITLITLGLLIWPLRKNRNSISYARQAQNIHYAKERIQELDEQLQNASISATDYEALKLEIENTLADDIDIAKQTEDEDNANVHTPKSNILVITLLCLMLPLGAIGLYNFVGTPESFSLIANSGVSQINNQQQKPKPANQDDVNQMLLTIENRLKDRPNDEKGWNLLATTYIKLGRYNDAKRSMINLMRIQGESAPLLTSIADATGRSRNGNLVGEPQGLLNRALAIDPNFPQALWMSGLASAQEKDTSNAIKYWERLLPLLDDVPQQQNELRALIEQSKTEAGSQINEKNTQVSVSQETDKQESTNQESTPPAQANGVRVSISIDPAIAEKANPSDLVFVFAKATQGPPAPLAVKRLTVADLPTDINLNDSDAMIDQFKLSLFENVTISARVAKSGNPIAQPGDLESSNVNTKNTTTETVELIISSEVE